MKRSSPRRKYPPRGGYFLLTLILFFPRAAFAWGERGHNVIARIAAMRIIDGVDLEKQSPADREAYLALRDYYREKALELGHLANIPDIEWRRGDELTKALNAPTHVFNSEVWTDDIATIPLEYAQAKEKAASRANDSRLDFFAAGTLIWRAEQLYELMGISLKKAAGDKPGSKEFSADVQQMLVYGGLMAHFIGDASMPYHSTKDHDGESTGEGGIHAYFETAALNTETPSLEARVYELAAPAPTARKPALPGGGLAVEAETPRIVCARLRAACAARALCAQAYSRIGEIRAADRKLIIQPGRGKEHPGRRSPEEAAALFRPIYEEQLARSASALARLWREAWEFAGKPDLSKAKYGDYALAPPFVEPDYDPEAVARVKSAARAPAMLK